MAAERARSMKSKIAMVFFGLALGCVAGETAVRVLDLKTEPEFVFHNLQQSDQKRLDRAILTNDAFNPAAVRIAFVGDSFTYGLGVEPGQTFVNRTGALLEERWSPRCKTVNLGEPGADMISEWLTYMGAKDRIRPHVVVHVLTPNDLDFDNYEGMWEVKRAYEVRLWPSRISRLFAFCEFAVRGKIGHRCTLDYMSGGATPEESTHIIREMRTVTDKPLVSKPNAGIPEIVGGRSIYPATPERYAKEVPNWIAAGARVVGGCCGAGVEHTAKIAAAAKAAGF